MKKIYTIIAALLFAVSAVSAQTGFRSLVIDDIRMIRSGGDVTVTFTLNAGKKATKAGYDLVVNPILRGDIAERALPSIVIRGRRSKVLDARHELIGGARKNEQSPRYMSVGGSSEYSATVPYEQWMRGGRLVFEGVSVGCCSSAEVELGLVAENILDAGPEAEARIVEITKTIGEQLAERYPFVAPASEFELLRQVLEQSPSTFDDGRSEISQRVIAQTREGSVSIFFGQGLRVIDSNFGDNNRNLIELTAAVRALASAPDAEIAAIVIAGFASPEGSVELNDRLAWDRAVAVKNFLTRNTDVDPRTIRIYNGGVDWAGLKELVEDSDIYNKQRIIDVIDYVPVWDPYGKTGRLGELMRMDGGEPYRYMAANFFPQLRQAAYIKVYYEDKTK